MSKASPTVRPSPGRERANHAPGPALDPALYGDSCALYYDQIYPRAAQELVRTLGAGAAGGPVLELGLATGRVALPLGSTGLQVHGIEASALMLLQFRRKPRPPSVHAAAGDFCRLPYRSGFRLVFCLVGTLGLLPSARLQLGCLREVARVLLPDGTFLCESFDDDAADSPTTHAHSLLTPTGLQEYSVTFLPTPPDVLDALAKEAGLALAARWGSWTQAPWAAGHPHCISVYRKGAGSASNSHSPGIPPR